MISLLSGIVRKLIIVLSPSPYPSSSRDHLKEKNNKWEGLIQEGRQMFKAIKIVMYSMHIYSQIL